MSRIAGVLLLAALVAGAGCGKRQALDPGDGGRLDAPVAMDSADPAPDMRVPVPRPDTGPPACVHDCPAPSGGSVCLAGRVVLLPSLAAEWSGLVQQATPLAPADGARLAVYDPIAFVSNPAGDKLLASAAIGAGGCFTVQQAKIPFTGFFILGCDDDKSTGKDRWVLTGWGETPQSGENSTDIAVPVLARKDIQAWAAELGQDPAVEGAMIAVFLDAGGRAVSGVTPLFDGSPPPWPGTNVHFFADDIRTPPYFAQGASATTQSGMVLVTGLPVKTFSGEKIGCTIEVNLCGSSPGTLLVRVLGVSGC